MPEPVLPSGQLVWLEMITLVGGPGWRGILGSERGSESYCSPISAAHLGIKESAARILHLLHGAQELDRRWLVLLS